MKNLFASAAVAVCLAGASAPSAAEAQRLWVFGDSLSDTGNLSLLFATDGNPNTYLPAAYTPYSPFPGLTLQRISNGKTTIEYVADYYGATLLPSYLRGQVGDVAANNFAVFGARASLTSRLDLPYQVAQLTERVYVRGLDVTEDRAVVAIGSNDVFAAWGAAIAPLQQGQSINVAAGEAILDQAVASLRTYLTGEGVQTIPSPAGNGSTVSVPSLAGLGLKKFLILNSPDIGSTPWVGQTAAAFGNPAVQAVASELTHYFNRELKHLVNDMTKGQKKHGKKKEGALEVTLIDLRKIADKVRKESTELGFTNTTDDCFLTNTLATLTQGTAPTPGVYRPTCSAELADQFMFLDTAHPTAAVHAQTGAKVVDKLPDCD